MAEITDEMITRALAVIMTPPGLWYFDDPDSVAHNREVIRRALTAVLRPDYAAGLADEDRIRARGMVPGDDDRAGAGHGPRVAFDLEAEDHPSEEPQDEPADPRKPGDVADDLRGLRGRPADTRWRRHGPRG